MIRTRKRTSGPRHVVMRNRDAASSATAEQLPDTVRPPHPPERPAQVISRRYESPYSISNGYTAERTIVLP
jgi:hypothetical protein